MSRRRADTRRTFFVVAAALCVAVDVAAQTAPADAEPHVHAIGPPLTALGAKLASADWLVAFLLNPSALRRPAIMRDLNLSVADAQSIAKYLLADAAAPPRHPRWRGGDAQRGERLFAARGCAACHRVRAGETGASPRIPNLAGIGLKVRGEWLFGWLQNPRAYNPVTAMPQLRLSAGECRDLTAFLLACRDGAERLPTAPRFDARADGERGRRAIERFDCARCHLINGFQTVAPTVSVPLPARACAGCHEPAVTSTRARSETPAAEAALENGRALIAHYHCQACHQIEGSGGLAGRIERKTLLPPVLDGEGARVRRAWLVDFLQHPRRLRPWLELQMPDFGLSAAEAEAVAAYFGALARMPADDGTDALPSPSRELIARGGRRFAHYKCGQCHPLGATAPSDAVDPEDLAIDLSFAKSRLRQTWVAEFLARPKAIAGPQSRMPAVFYTVDGTPKVDDADGDIAAITAYLFAAPNQLQQSSP